MCHILANTLFYGACLPVDNIFADVYKVEHLSDEEILASISDEENDNTCYPSECVVEHWNQVKETRNEKKDKSKQGHCTPQLVSPYQ